MGREELRSALSTLIQQGTLVRASGTRQQTKMLQRNQGIPLNATVEYVMDEMIARQKKSIVVTLDSLLGLPVNDSAAVPLSGGGGSRGDAGSTAARLRLLVAGLRRALGSNVSVNLYLSAAGDRVLPAHTDKYDVFVLQLWAPELI